MATCQQACQRQANLRLLADHDGADLRSDSLNTFEH
jgi:hypothetical protein